ncbi:PspC domain-containing protein [Gracilibacillus dipsosauri]|uniref:PspC domain-containing protein n=1 Tax=Gracilibacillus dipsosauri TaxID=178340 RepID=A0A317L686_9BACI|nr:PspC domain-containing protein [Gracilibacillus dipsosauri]PWU69269.1 PspC domain-containing protein [Gracilibacillus dipsosauri]
MGKKLYRSDHDKMLAGVLGGVAELTDLDATILRIIYVILTIFTAGFPLFVLYIASAIIIPRREAE